MSDLLFILTDDAPALEAKEAEIELFIQRACDLSNHLLKTDSALLSDISNTVNDSNLLAMVFITTLATQRDKLRAEVEELNTAIISTSCAAHRPNRHQGVGCLQCENTRLTAEVDAVRKERDEANRRAMHHFTAHGTLDALRGELDAAQARCGELERLIGDLVTRKVDAGGVLWSSSNIAGLNPELSARLESLLTPSQPDNFDSSGVGDPLPPNGFRMLSAEDKKQSLPEGAMVFNGVQWVLSEHEGEILSELFRHHYYCAPINDSSGETGRRTSNEADRLARADDSMGVQVPPAVKPSRPEPVKAGECDLLQEVHRLREIIKSAPHEKRCGVYGDGTSDHPIGKIRDCDCFKSKAERP